MKDIFIIWIIIQLVAIGAASALIHNEIVEKKYECMNQNSIGVLSSAFFPLAYFVPESTELKNYCYPAKNN